MDGVAAEIVVAPPNSLVLVVTAGDAEVPETMDGLVASADACVAVGTKCEVDGRTKLVLTGGDDPTHAASHLVFDGRLRSQGSIRIMSVLGETYLETSLEAPTARVRIWVDDMAEPEIVVVATGGSRADSGGRRLPMRTLRSWRGWRR